MSGENDCNDERRRLTELEIRLSYQQDGQETLHQVLLSQQQQIRQLQEQISMLNNRIKPYMEELHDAEGQAAEPPPPHY